MSCFRLMRGSRSLPTFRLIRSQSLWQQLGKHAVNPIHGETGRCIFAFSLCNKSGEGSFRKCLCSCWKTVGFFPFVYYVSVGLMNTELIHYQNQMIWRVHVLFGSFESMDNLLGPLVLLLKLGGESVLSGFQENPSQPCKFRLIRS